MTPQLTLAKTKLKILSLIGDQPLVDLYDNYEDPIAGGQTSAQLMLDAIEGSFLAISERVFKQTTFLVDGLATEVDLPVDFIDIEGVRDLTTGEFIARTSFKVGSVVTSGWYLYPENTLTFATELGTEGAEIFYSALWSFDDDIYGIVAEDTVLPTPTKLNTAVLFYSVYYCLLQRLSQSAVLRQYGTKVDSGNPEDNPLKDAANIFLAKFYEEMRRYPATQKGFVGA